MFEPEGFPTRQDLVDAESTSDRPMVLNGMKALVLRPDGTAFEERDIVEGSRGFYFHGLTACGPG